MTWAYLGRGKGTKRGMGLGPGRGGGATSGVSFLPSTIEINSIEETAAWRYEAKDISGTTWTAAVGGVDLSESGSGSSPVVTVETAFDDGSKVATFQAGKYFTVADNAVHDVTTEDKVVEVVSRFGGTNSYICAKGTDPGWRIREFTNFQYLNLGGAGNISATGLTGNDLIHTLYFLDRSGSGRVYSNGVAISTTSISAHSGDESNTSNFSIGADSGGSFPTTCGVIMIQAWKRSAWLDTHVQDTLAAARYNLLMGT